ncbi:tyrosine-type recombinase/integrase [Botrimarina mediterranea]|uniref:Tyrosine recombinase XerC n=1 Tax=Botrimarina mediterranea TaxID=2528022 RepID=A0A518K5L7_9BACT|nr:site-specific integrase [Botrimarina mediterranea]QDV73067.1 Tyrosine recombinase XerC [Botrimarina mediterranea]
MTTWKVDRERILTAAEVRLVLDELTRKARRSALTRRQLILFRLATCCGLRASELTGLTLDNVRLGARPSIRVPKSIGKGGKARTVPLHWDAATLADLKDWKAQRIAQGATGSDLFVCTSTGKPIARKDARLAFQSACKPLGRHVTIHDGRHSFVSHALHAGRSIVEVRDAVGHSNIATTSLYAHLVSDDDSVVGNLF